MKKCPKCNVALPDDAAFCGNCGTNLSEDFAKEDTTNSYYLNETQNEPVNNTILESAKAQNRNAKLGLTAIISGVSLIFVIVLVIICNLSFGNNYKKPVKGLAKYLNDNEYKLDIEEYIGLFVPQKGIDTYKDALKIISHDNPDITNKIQKSFNSYSKKKFYKSYQKEYGDDYSISISIKNAEKITKEDDEWDEIEDHWKDLATQISDLDIDDKDTIKALSEEYEFILDDKSIKKLSDIGEELSDYVDTIKIQDIRKLKIKTTIKGNNGDDKSTNKTDLYVVKINGKWIIDFTYSDEFISVDMLNEN